MSFQWSQQAPAFEFPTCYRTENRFLTLRAAGLILLALVVVWVSLASPEAGGRSITLTKVERGGSEIHVALAVMLMLLAAVDLWVASRQQRMLLAPGQPAPLANELLRASKGVSSGAAWLKQVLKSGVVPAPPLRTPYRRALLAIAPQIPVAPTSLQSYLSLRIAHFTFATGLLLALGITWALSPPPPLALAALFYSALATGLVARSAWIARSAPSPAALAIALAVALVAGVALALLGGQVPGIGRLAAVGVAPATALLLLLLMLIEGLALLAARVGIDSLPSGTARSARVKAELSADPDRLLEELERELHRYWAEGVPNRRFAWQTGSTGTEPNESRHVVSVLEESQPVLPLENRDRIPEPPLARRVWLLALGGLGVVMTLVGGMLWIRLAHAHVQDASAPLTLAASALVLIVAGGYACRIGHILWSRIEVESTLIWLECRRASGSEDSGGAAAADTDEGTLNLQLRINVTQARSVFYAGAEHKIGTRTLLRLQGDEAAGSRSIEQLRAYTSQPRGRAKARPPGWTAPKDLSPGTPPQAAAPIAPAAPKFCPACGKPVVPGSRFCQHCGAPLRSGP